MVPLGVRLIMTMVLLLAVACGGNDDAEMASATSVVYAAMEEASPTTTVSFEAMQDSEAAAAEATADEAVDDGPVEPVEGDGAPIVTPADLGRDIIYRGSISVAAPDVEAATREATNIVQGMGGIVFGQRVLSLPEASSSLTFKVLPADFIAALDRLAGVGELLDRRLNADDVTERLVDFRSRISTAEASVIRLRTLLEEAADLEDVALIERELLHRETDLETLRGQVRTLSDAVALATIDMTITLLTEPLLPSVIDVSMWVADSDEDPCLGDNYIEAPSDGEVFFCIEVENPGEIALVDIELSSEELRLRSRDGGADRSRFHVLEGRLDRLEPGDLTTAVLRIEVEDGRLAGRVATRGLEVQVRAEASPEDAEENGRASVSDAAVVYVDIRDDPEGPPSFFDSFGNGYYALMSVLGYALASLGVIIPFIPVVLILAALYWWISPVRRRGRSKRVADETSPPEDKDENP